MNLIETDTNSLGSNELRRVLRSENLVLVPSAMSHRILSTVSSTIELDVYQVSGRERLFFLLPKESQPREIAEFADCALDMHVRVVRQD